MGEGAGEPQDPAPFYQEPQLASFLRGWRTTAATALVRLPCNSPVIPPLHPSLTPWCLHCVCSAVSNSAVPRTVACHAPLSMEFSRPAYWSVLPSLPPGNLPTQGSNPGLLHLPHWQEDLLPLCCLPSFPDFKPFLPLGHQNLQPLRHRTFPLSSSPVFLSLDPPLPPSSKFRYFPMSRGNFFFPSDNATLFLLSNFFFSRTNYISIYPFEIQITQCYSEWWLCVRHKGYKR